MPKISVIIPVYNVDNYLRRCLDSVCHQTYSNLEIICVDDCSTDNSLAILNEYAAKDARIYIMQRQENGGQAAARQTGIDVATGEYISFVDSDDWVDVDYYEKMLKVALQNKTDIVINSSILVHEGEKVYPQSFQGHNMLERKVYDNPAQLVEKFFCVVWNKLFRMDFLKQQKYTLPKANTHEDVFFHYITFAIAKNVSFFDGPNYHYLHRERSLAQVKHDWGIAHIKVYSYIYDFYKEHGLLDKKIKLYATMPQFNITDDETFNVYKSYFAKVSGYINQNSDIFNEADKFIANAVANCPDYTTYKAAYPANLMISFLRRKK